MLHQTFLPGSPFRPGNDLSTRKGRMGDRLVLGEGQRGCPPFRSPLQYLYEARQEPPRLCRFAIGSRRHAGSQTQFTRIF
jgi:hypothetical protein